MIANLTPFSNNRLGFHYFPDTFHYQQSDLRTWLPELKSLDASWLTLIAPNDHAIPEPFLRGLMDDGIQPILHIKLPLDKPANTDTLKLLINMYAKWGVEYITLFDRPNLRTVWSSTSWAQSDLVERFLDLYLPLANLILQAGIKPVFPPLEPGGDYWDTAFLRAALQSIQRRVQTDLLDALILGAYAWADSQQLNWGAGGPERWPSARPYFTPVGQQDQRGFYIFDWYLAIAKAVLSNPRPIMLLGAGSRLKTTHESNADQVEAINHAKRNLVIAQRLFHNRDTTLVPFALEPVSPLVMTCNFWLLVADPHSSSAAQAWFLSDGSTLPVVEAVRQWMSDRTSEVWTEPTTRPEAISDNPSPAPEPSIAHYLLLPLYEWGVADWQLEAIRPFVTKYHPTIGFSVNEAAKASLVTVVGGERSYPEGSIRELQEAGCTVEEITGDGTSIATQLATL